MITTQTASTLLRSHIEQTTDGPHWQQPGAGKALAIAAAGLLPRLLLFLIIALAVN